MYRNKQLRDLQKGTIDLDEIDESSISLADFSLADFRMDLLRFLENNRELLESAELGLFAVVPPDPELPAAQPGVLFCLRQRDDKRPTEVNPLAPYYLVYLLDGGNVRLTFMQPKQCLELFRTLATGQASAFTKALRRVRHPDAKRPGHDPRNEAVGRGGGIHQTHLRPPRRRWLVRRARWHLAEKQRYPVIL